MSTSGMNFLGRRVRRAVRFLTTRACTVPGLHVPFDYRHAPAPLGFRVAPLDRGFYITLDDTALEPDEDPEGAV